MYCCNLSICYLIVAIFLFGQVFGAQFTKANLKRYLGKSSKKVLVECSPSRTSCEVEMKMGSLSHAIMTTGWPEAMAEIKLREGDIVVFSFTPITGQRYKLHLDMIKLVK